MSKSRYMYPSGELHEQCLSLPGGEVSEEAVLPVPDGQVLVLCRGRDDLDEAADLRLAVERHGEELDGGVVNVVVGGDHAQVQGRCVHVLLNADALAVLQF
jgi:hypothetical protein